MPRTVCRYDCSVFLHSVYNFSDYAHFMMSKYYNFVQFAINMIRFVSKRHFISQQRQWRSQQLWKKIIHMRNSSLELPNAKNYVTHKIT